MVETHTSSYEIFARGIWRENPVFVQVMGMCPMLAVTNSAVNGLAMGDQQCAGDGLREEAELSAVPAAAQGAALTLLMASILSLAFMGLRGALQLGRLICLAGLPQRKGDESNALPRADLSAA